MVLLGVIGQRFSGVTTFVNHLIETQGFGLLEVDLHLEGEKSKDSSPTQSIIKFHSFSEAVQYATSNWRQKLIISDLQKYPDFELAFKRPFFVLICIQAPLSLRYFRRNQKYENDDLTLSDLSLLLESEEEAKRASFESSQLRLDTFLELDEFELYNVNKISKGEYSLYDFIRKASITIFNNGSSLDHFKKQIDQLDFNDPQYTRPSWDSYFMALCELASQRSNCMKRRVGCILVSENRVISTGYNGTPKNVLNCNEGGCPRCNGNASCGSSLDHCICMHAEENALLEAGRERITNRNVTLYCNTCPCLGCAKKVIQVGIKEVVYAQDYGMDTMTRLLFKNANVVLRQINALTVTIQPGVMHSLH